MNKNNIKLILVGMILISCFLMGTASAEVELFTYLTPQDIREDDFDISVEIKSWNISSSEYPLKIEYLLNDEKMFNKTIGNGSTWSLSTWFSVQGKSDRLYPRTEVLVYNSTGFLIDSVNKYEPTYLIDPFKETADFQLISINIEKIDDGILGWFKEDSYQTTFLVKNMNHTFAFKGDINFGDLGVLSDWKFSERMIIGPRQTIKIEGPKMTEGEMKDIKTELRYCVFC